MSKIVLQKIYLVNWYGFVDKVIPLGKNLSLITGENECGKSTVLDAVKYAFTGDTEFNKATSASGKRTLSSYTRCLIDPDTKKYARSVETYSNVYTHIALEYWNELYDKYFVLGVILETNSSDIVENYWYSIENKKIADLSFFRENDHHKYVLNAKQFRDWNKVELLNKSNGIVKFMTMTGLRLQNEGIRKYQRKLRSIMTYNPEARIQQFIKESVLEEKKINLAKLKEAKDNIDELTKSLEKIEKEISDLNYILECFDEYSRIHSKLMIDEAKRNYKALLNTNKKIETNRQHINDNIFEINRLTDLLKQEILTQEQLKSDLRNAERQLDKIDGTKGIQDEKDRMKQLNTKANEYKEKINILDDLVVRTNEFINRLSFDFELANLSNPDISSSIKHNDMNELKALVSQLLKKLSIEHYSISDSLKEVQDQINQLDEIIKTCDKNLPDYSKVPNNVRLLQEINKKFKELNIDSEAKFSSYYVVELKDEEWRDSVETFLGIHRYSILVEPQYFDIANQVMDDSEYKYVELVNTKLLCKRDFTVVNDSLLHQLEIKNEIAKKYFSFWLGKIHAVQLSEVPNWEQAISKEGKISKNMAVSFLNFNRLGAYCLGEDAVKLNKEKAEKHKRILENQERTLYEKKENCSRQINSTQSMYQLINKEYDLDAPNKYAINQIEIYECNKRIKKLEDALEQNNEYLLLVERISEIEDKSNAIMKSIEKIHQHKNSLEVEINLLRDNNTSLEQQKERFEDRLEDLFSSCPTEVKQAKIEYNQFLEGKNEIGDIMNIDTRQRMESEKLAYERSITNKQSVYNVSKRAEELLPVGIEYEANYRKRKRRLDVDNFEEIKAKLIVQTEKYESIFKNEFVLKIKANVEAAQTDIKEINRQLKKLKFATTYQFDVKNISGASDYAKILDYAEYLKKTNRLDNGQLVLGDVVGYDEKEASNREIEIREIINKIIVMNNGDLLNAFADYRNYMEYEVLVSNDEITNGRLSKLAGYDSGAGTQIPYTIILSAALAIIYNTRQNSTRLVFIDEPFEKMSDKNIKIMLDFFKSQNFQVVFCAPPNKLDSIGRECDAVIPIKKISKSKMTLGAIRFYE